VLRSDACEPPKISEVQRFDEIIVEPGTQRVLDISRSCPTRHRDDEAAEEPPIRSQRLDDLIAVDIWQAEVDKDQIGRKGARDAEHVAAALCAARSAAEQPECGRSRLCNIWLVLDDQHAYATFYRRRYFHLQPLSDRLRIQKDVRTTSAFNALVSGQARILRDRPGRSQQVTSIVEPLYWHGACSFAHAR
jgi:hypothetical protein